MKKEKGFVLSWFYPPINSSESFVTYKLLSQSELQYDVWTRESRSNNVWDRDVKETGFDAQNIKVLSNKNDDIKTWIDEAYKYFVEHIDEYDFVMTRSMPPEAHFLGKKIKENFPEKKWVASFGDPLVGTPYLTFDTNENPYLLRKYIEDEQPSRLQTIKLAFSPMRNAQKMIWTKKQKALGRRVDYSEINDFTIRMADLILVNNTYQYHHMFSGPYEEFKDKGIIIPHTFLDNLYPKVTKKKNKKIVFTYTGHLDSIRNATPLLSALDRMLRKDPNLVDKAEFDFYGNISDEDKLFIINNNLYDLVKLKGNVSYRDSLKIMKESDWLLLFDANFTKLTDENIYFPAKLADYIGSGSDVLAITQIKGASADIVRETGGLVCSHSVDEIEMYLSKIIYKKYKPEEIKENKKDNFAAKVVARELDNNIERILK